MKTGFAEIDGRPAFESPTMASDPDGFHGQGLPYRMTNPGMAHNARRVIRAVLDEG
ncbi:hypothetical protein ABR737_43245 [Streptomyces sp. Edi2]|uniref:hypothetical protein n=1 Tax=Streptomyces sp. Edi2 TaxID=3162528 RepID=UPI0033063A96